MTRIKTEILKNHYTKPESSQTPAIKGIFERKPLPHPRISIKTLGYKFKDIATSQEDVE